MSIQDIARPSTPHLTNADALRGLCGGAVYLPGDAGYDEARTPWNVAVDQRPAAVAYPANAVETAQLVRAAVAAGLEAKGWLVSRQVEPDGIHLHLNPLHAEVAGEYVAALREAAVGARDAAAGPREEVRAY